MFVSVNCVETTTCANICLVTSEKLDKLSVNSSTPSMDASFIPQVREMTPSHTKYISLMTFQVAIPGLSY